MIHIMSGIMVCVAFVFCFIGELQIATYFVLLAIWFEVYGIGVDISRRVERDE